MPINIKKHEQLLALERVLDSYLFKQPESGEAWHISYKSNRESFDLLSKQQAKLKQIVHTYFMGQANRVNQLVHLHLIVAADKPNVDRYINTELWDKENKSFANALADGIFPIFTNGARTQATAFKALTPITAASSPYNAPSQQFLTNYTLQLASDLNDTTQASIKSAIQTSLALGESRDELANRIDDIINNPYRSTMIAQTESVRAFNSGRLAVAKDMGYGFKTWEAVPDACPYCDDLDGTSISVDDTFESDLGDVDQPPLHPNCRCGVKITKDDPNADDSDTSDDDNSDDTVGAAEIIKGKVIKGGWITTASGNRVLIDDSYGSKLPSVSNYENSIRNSDTEHEAVFDKDGKTVYQDTGQGTSHSVGPNPNTNMYQQVTKGNGYISVHNHPDQAAVEPNTDLDRLVSAPSFSDLAVNASQGIQEIRVVTPRLTTVTTLAKGTTSQISEAMDKAREVGDKVYNDNLHTNVPAADALRQFAMARSFTTSLGGVSYAIPYSASVKSSEVKVIKADNGEFVTISKGGNSWVVPVADLESGGTSGDGASLASSTSTMANIRSGMVSPDAMDMLKSQGYTNDQINALTSEKITEVNNLADEVRTSSAVEKFSKPPATLTGNPLLDAEHEIKYNAAAQAVKDGAPDSVRPLIYKADVSKANNPIEMAGIILHSLPIDQQINSGVFNAITNWGKSAQMVFNASQKKT